MVSEEQKSNPDKVEHRVVRAGLLDLVGAKGELMGRLDLCLGQEERVGVKEGKDGAFVKRGTLSLSKKSFPLTAG